MANDKFITGEEEKTKSFFWLTLGGFVVNGLGVGLVIFFYSRLQPQVPLFYSLAEGNAQLADKKWLFLIPTIGLAINVWHLILLRAAKNTDAFLKRLFALITLIFEVLIFVIILRIILLII